MAGLGTKMTLASEQTGLSCSPGCDCSADTMVESL